MKRSGVSDILPLTPFQEGLLFHALYDDQGPDVYAVQVIAELEGELDPVALRSACQALLRRHPNLRACFQYTSSGRAVQVIPRAVEAPWAEHDLSALGEAERAAERTRIIEQDRKRRFDLGRPPLLRFTLLPLGARRHVFVLTNHHILLDGWSLPMMLLELLMLYANAGSDAGLPPVAPYRDYLAWLNAQDLDAARDAWRAALAGIEEPTWLAGEDFTGRRPVMPDAVVIEMPASETAELTEWARRQQLTVSTIVQGCWAVLLGTLTGSNDVVFGATVAGRPPQVPGVESMIGMFMNTLPVRARLNRSRTLADFLAGLQEWSTSLLPYQHIGLGEVQQLAGRGTLFDTVVIFESYPLASAADSDEFRELPGGLRLAAAEGLDASHYPVNIRVAPGRRLLFRVEYRPDLLRREQVQEIADNLIHLLRQVITHADRPLGTLRPARPVDGGVMVGPAGEVTGGVVERVCEVAEAAGESVAIVDDAVGAVSYAELVRSAAALAERLSGMGVRPGCLVAVVAAPGAEFVGSVLGVLWAGGGFVPVDVRAPAGRTAGMLADAGVSVVVAAREWTGLAAELAAAAAAAVLVAEWPFARPGTTGTSADAAAGDPSARDVVDGAALPVVRGRLADVAYVIFTSGSTGRPKGAMVARRGMLNHLLAKVADLALTSADCVVANAPVTFDVSVWQMLAALLVGGRIRVAHWEVAADPAGLFALASAERATVLEVVPSVLRAALDAWAATEAGVPDLGKLRWLVATGEAVPPEVCARWFGVYPQVPVVNAYGPTECSDDVTHAVLRGTTDVAGPRVPIGAPVRNTRLYVLGERLDPVPAGVVGELYVGGAGVGLGYVRDPGRTAAVFAADPFGPEGARMYRTGDRVVARPDGQLEFVDRRDHQVKVRGHRIELGEVEAALLAATGVTDAAAAVTHGPGGQAQLAGYLVLADGQTVDGVRTALAAELPGYLIPTAWSVLDALPLTPHGKIDRAALPARAIDGQAGASGGRAARTPHEQVICDVFAHVLGLSQVCATDNFFDLGGHSLLATRAITRLRSLTGVDLPIRALFDAPTPAALALATTQAADATGGDRPALTPGPRPDPLPLSAGQQRLWFLNQIEGPSATYNLPVAFRLHQAPDPAALSAALADLAIRHETLRTIYPDANGTPYQHVLESTAGQPLLRHTHLPAHELLPTLTETAVQGFDLTSQLPLRAHLFTTTGKDGTGEDGQEEENVLLLVLHHIAADGWSAGPLARDLATAYAARLSGHAPDWQPLLVQYADYALWQERMLGDPADPGSLAARQLGYWRQALAGLPEELALPTDRPRPARASYQGKRSAITIPAATHTQLAALARQHGATMFMVIHAALAALLTRLGAGTDIPIGAPIAGRTDDALDDLVGFFVNTLVLRADTAGDPPFTTLLQRVRDVSLAAHAHQDLPFERLVDDLRPARSLARQPLAQIMLFFQNTAPPPVTSVLPATVLPLHTETAKSDLVLELAELHAPDGAPAGIDGYLEYATDLFDPPTASALAARLTRLLAAAADAPATRLSQLPILTTAERRQLLHDWNATSHATPSTTLSRLFQAAAARAPQAVAVTAGDVTLTYAELNARANRLAWHLIGLGAGPERLVAVAMDRTADLIVAVLAVLKSGAAYLPVDPAYPADRIEFMLTDARPVTILATAGTAHRLPADAPRLALDDPATQAAIAQHPAANPDAPLQPGHPAYVIYTSGSTGKPKGVVVEHRSVTSLMSWAAAEFTPGELSRVLASTSLSFDVSVFEIFGTLTAGGSIEIVPNLLALTSGPWCGSMISAVPTPLAHVLATPGTAAQAEVVALCGEALSGQVVATITATLPGARIVNIYGPTEATVYATTHAVGGQAAGAPPIGRPIWNTRAYVLDPELQLVPTGVAGELYLAGVQLARGYLNRPGLTAERFAACPFGGPGERMYRTGDLARWNASGQLEYVSRIDDQVKIRGFRVELGEVEAVLAAQPGVAQAAATVREDQPGDKRLAAYVVPAAGATPDPAALREAVGRKLPGYMVPASITVLGKLPLSPAGKLDRRALPAPEYAAAPGGRAPATPGEKALCVLFAEVLGVEQVGIDQDFFVLGGNSLLAARFMIRVRSELGAELSIRDLFEAPTVAELAGRLENRDDASFDTLVPLRRGGERPALFCLHPSGGMAWMYIGLAPHLDPAYPIYGLQAKGIIEPAELPATIEAMASGYVSRIRAAQQSGPYFLVGWSFGGALAHEIAVQLQEQGEEVGLLALLDTYPSSGADTEDLDKQQVLREILGRLGHDEIPKRDLTPAEIAVALQQFSNPLSGFTESQISNLLNVWSHNVHLHQDFRPRRYTGKMIVFTATQGRASDAPEPQDWSAYVDGAIESHDVDCEHEEMMEEAPMRTIGTVIAAEIEQADRTGRG